MNPNKELKLIVGIGNYGRQYTRTRHNAGVLALEYMCESLNVKMQTQMTMLGKYGEKENIQNGGRRGANNANIKLLFYQPFSMMNIIGTNIALIAQKK